MPTSAETSSRRVVPAPAATRSPRMPTDWLRATIAGLEAALLSWLTVVVPAVATYVATAAAPALGQASWLASARTGTSLWLLGHGSSLVVAGAAEITLVPLGLTLLSVLLVYGSTRRMRLSSVGSGGFTVAGYVLAVAALALVATGTGERWPAIPGALVTALLGVVPAMWHAGAPEPAWFARVRQWVPSWFGAGLRAAGWSILSLVGCAVILTLLAIVQGLPRMRDLHEALAPDPVSTVALVVAQLAFVPTAVVWALSWFAGPGFVLGVGTQFSPTVAASAPLPAVPLLGALPQPGAPELVWVVVVPVLVGTATGVYLDRRHRQPTLPRALLSALTTGAGAAVVAAALVLSASGSIGPGRMSEVGADAPLVAAAVFAEVALGGLVAVVALHPRTHEALRTATGAIRSRLSRGASPQSDVDF